MSVTVPHPQKPIHPHPRPGGRGGEGAVWRAAGHPLWRPGQRTPQAAHCLRGLNCPGSCQHAVKDQPRADHIPEQRLAASRESRAGLRGRKDILPQAPEKAHCDFLNNPRFPPEASVGPAQFLGGLLLSGLHQGPPGGTGPPGLVRLALRVLVRVGPAEIKGSHRKKRNSCSQAPQSLTENTAEKWPQGTFGYVPSLSSFIELSAGEGS